MEAVLSIKPLLAVLIPLLVVPILVSSRTPNVREAWTFVAAIAKLIVVISMVPAVLRGDRLIYTVAQVIPGVPIEFKVDALGMLFALVAASLWVVTSAYSIGYMRGLKEHSQTRYFSFFAVALSSTMGVAFSANLLTLYLFYEMLSLATFPLVTHHQDAEARTSGRKYLTYILGTSIGLLLPAMLMCYVLTETLTFSAQGFLSGAGSSRLMGVLLLMFVFGFAKAAVFPFHGWLPAAMVAPTPVSALLHAVAVVKVGVFSIVRVLTGVFGIDLLASMHLGPLICVIASITVLIASLIALSQDNLKRLLAFSTIGQLSYIILGVGLLSPKGVIGGVLHIAMHAFGKITLFFCAGAIFVATGKRNISEMSGIGRRMPMTMAAFFFGSLSIIGLPPTGGFLSKWYLVLGSLQAHQQAVLWVLLISSLLNAAYFMPVVYRAFFYPSETNAGEENIHEAPAFCVVPLMVTSLISIGLLFYPEPFFRLASMVAQGVTGGSG